MTRSSRLRAPVRREVERGMAAGHERRAPPTAWAKHTSSPLHVKTTVPARRRSGALALFSAGLVEIRFCPQLVFPRGQKYGPKAYFALKPLPRCPLVAHPPVSQPFEASPLRSAAALGPTSTGRVTATTRATSTRSRRASCATRLDLIQQERRRA